ncbi:MAG: histidine--tRNA ligase, partial [Bacteroidota bacterium]
MDRQITKPSILPGFMELLPAEQIAFNQMMDTIRSNFERYGFIPLDTPLLEKAEVLLAKGGGETEKQVYRFTKGDNDLALRFDLTVPLARYVAQHFPDLSFPFRRYHIGKVYRGERNQKGRFREFYQCDIDIIGLNKLSLINDAEIPSIIYSTFKGLGFDSFTIRLNNRKLLNGFFDSLGIQDKSGVLRAIDKLDKIGLDAVMAELRELGATGRTGEAVAEFINIKGSNDQILASLQQLGIDNPQFNEGLEELSRVVHYIKCFDVPEANIAIDLTIARGLDYYTGTVYETILNDHPGIGSVCSGGRYENLAGFYTKQQLPGVGISIGLTRLFYQIQEAKLIQLNQAATLTEVLIIPMNIQIEAAIGVANQLREAGIIAELYLEETKLDKKITYANKLGIPYVV